MLYEPKVNILLVDDHPENLTALEAILGRLEQHLVKARSGEQALKCLLDQDFAVILLDVQMPGMSGFETATLIRQRERSRHTPIIFLTAFSNRDDLKFQGYALGAVDFLLKPINPTILNSKVSVFVDLFKKSLEIQQQADQLIAKNLEILRAEAAQQQAEEANRMKDEFLAIVSHELRTPLNSILGWSQLLLTQKIDSEKMTQALQTIIRNAKSQAQLIDDILDISKLMQGKARLSIQPTRALAVIQSAIETISPLADQKTIQIQTELDSTIPLVAADPDRLQQIIWNLLINAIKFTPEGGTITIQLSLASDAKDFQVPMVQLQVIDTGIGIEAAFLPYIFDRFCQADSSSTRSQGGLGLGLAIVHQLVALHHGQISADSPGPGKGTTFTIYLPVAVSSVSSALEPYPFLETSNGSFNPQPSLAASKVLLVEDNFDSRIFITTVLEAAGAEVIAVDSATAAIAQLQYSTPHILVSDIAMPEINGYQLLHHIQSVKIQAGKPIPAIALTAYSKPEDHTEILAAGFQKYLAKPVDPEELITAIAQLIQAN